MPELGEGRSKHLVHWSACFFNFGVWYSMSHVRTRPHTNELHIRYKERSPPTTILLQEAAGAGSRLWRSLCD